MIVSYCAKHNQYVKHVNARGIWGHAPQGNFENRSSEIEFGDVLETVYNASAH